MEPEMITQLLEKIDRKQYAMAIRHLSHNNKKLRIPGFSIMEKAPTKLVANTARTNKIFRKALYESISIVVLNGIKVDLTQSIDEIKKGIPQAQWLGLAAHLLMINEEEYSTEAFRIISENGMEGDSKDHEQLPKSEPESKPDKKEEKFREKYLKVKNENSELSAELEKCKGQIQEANAEIEKLKKIQSELDSRCAAYMAEIDALTDEKSRLIQQLQEVTEKAQAIQAPRIDIRVLAPNCKDLLEKYMDTIPLDFDGALDMNVTDAIEKYNEIWVFSDVVPFGTYRVLRKWKKVAEDKVFIFQTVGDLVAHAEKMLQADGRR